jgi:hypothetical protein
MDYEPTTAAPAVGALTLPPPMSHDTSMNHLPPIVSKHLQVMVHPVRWS